MSKQVIGSVESFDFAVEEQLDQVTDDENVRGKIRWLLLTMTEENIRALALAKEAGYRAGIERAIEVFLDNEYDHAIGILRGNE